MESENRHDFDTTIATFGHLRYELDPTGDVFDGEGEVRAYFAEGRTAFPDQRNEIIALRHADDSVIVDSTCSAPIWGGYVRRPDRPLVSVPYDGVIPLRRRPARM
jgi:hypothetical protein